ncbi:hypothetical protein [Lentzea sp. NBRC 102530]|uniref:hypothetical protein n=1 Tax=Lentzea sp. NBRC 102530 TaxID=3032201 RepID=UPI0024A51CB6|nr:hypothetical protein [Lentzea sp. NBRC 102530]GLY55271.1 hypothetical protein Lesp01_89260 [Lentzea sp. NBRC 102530]
MDSYELRLWLLVACLCLFGVGVYLLVLRSRRKEERARVAELAALAERLGGVLEDRSAGALPWSAESSRAMGSQYGSLLKWLGRASAARFDHALEFTRNGWRVRVTEASMEVATSTSTRTARETRIEVATNDLVSLKIKQVYGGGGGGGSVADMPPTVARQEQPLWMQLRLPASVDHAYVAYTSDLAGAAHVFNPDMVELLLARTRRPVLQNLCLDSGIAWTVFEQPIHEVFLLRLVDAIIELLELVPGAKQRVSAA